jgi:hypothetical protein
MLLRVHSLINLIDTKSTNFNNLQFIDIVLVTKSGISSDDLYIQISN